MRSRFGLAVLFGVGLVVLAPAAEALDKSPPPGPSVQQLVEQLGDQDFRKRDAAGRALEALGPKILPALQKARAHGDPEVRRRLDDLIPSLELASILTPKRLSLKLTKKNVKSVMDEIEKQTGYKIEFWGGNNNQEVYSFDFANTPFWQAFDEICEKTGMVVQNHGYGDDRLRLNYLGGNGHLVPHVHHEGPFRIVANSFNYSRSVDFSSRPRTPAATNRSEHLSFNFTVFVEPKMPLLSLGAVKLDEAYDENRVSMVPNQANDGNMHTRHYRYGHGYKSLCQQTSVNLTPTSEKARSVKYLRGSVPVTILAEQKPEVVSDKILTAKGKKVKCGQTLITVEEVTDMPGKQYQIKLSLQEDGRDHDYTWMNSLYQRIELQDDKGNKFQSYGTSWGSSGPGTAQVTFTYGRSGGPRMGPPTKLIFHTWNTIQHQVTFEFRDLPLP